MTTSSLLRERAAVAVELLSGARGLFSRTGAPTRGPGQRPGCCSQPAVTESDPVRPWDRVATLMAGATIARLLTASIPSAEGYSVPQQYDFRLRRDTMMAITGRLRLQDDLG